MTCIPAKRIRPGLMSFFEAYDTCTQSLCFSDLNGTGELVVEGQNGDTLSNSIFTANGEHCISYSNTQADSLIFSYRLTTGSTMTLKRFELVEQCEEVLLVANILNSQDYYPFGMVMPGRSYQGSARYRYGFNGKELDDEVLGDANQYDYGFRIYNPRIGRFLSVDPLSSDFPWYTPYQYAGNMPIWAIDIDGLEPKVEGGVLIGYNVQSGQGPTQIAEDINNPETQKKWGYCLLEPVTWDQIVQDNIELFKLKSNVLNFEDINEPGYWDMNINPGEPISITSAQQCLEPNKLNVVEQTMPVGIPKGTELLITQKTLVSAGWTIASVGVSKVIIQAPNDAQLGYFGRKLEVPYTLSPTLGPGSSMELFVKIRYEASATTNLEGEGFKGALSNIKFNGEVGGAIIFFGSITGFDKDYNPVIEGNGKGHGLGASLSFPIFDFSNAEYIDTKKDSIEQARKDTALFNNGGGREYLESVK